jgi:hypothetical protein
MKYLASGKCLVLPFHVHVVVLAFHVFLAVTTCVAGNAVNVLTMPLLEEIM